MLVQYKIIIVLDRNIFIKSKPLTVNYSLKRQGQENCPEDPISTKGNVVTCILAMLPVAPKVVKKLLKKRGL